MGKLRLVPTSSSAACGLNFVRRLHDVSCEFPGRPFSSVNLSQLRPPKSGCSRRESHLHVATTAGPRNNKKVLDEVDPIGFGRKTRHLFDELRRKLLGLVQFSCSSGYQDIIVRDGVSWVFTIPGSQNTTALFVEATINIGRKLMRRVYHVKSGQEIDIVLISCAGSGLGIKPTRRKQVLKAKKVELPPDKENTSLTTPGSSIQEKLCSCCRGAMAGVVLNLLAAAIMLCASSPQALAMTRTNQQEQNESNQETLSNIPPFLSPSSPSETKSSQIQHPKSRKAESCTVKCLNTCIRGVDGVGPLNVRRPIVVFKPGFRSRKYCLVECSDICNLLKDGDDGP